MISSGAFLPVKIELTPSFSVRVAGRSTHAPGTRTLIAARKAAAVPEPGWGRSGRIAALLVPPTLVHLVAVHM